MKKYECEICGEEFEKWQQKANHVRWKHKKIKYSEDGRKNFLNSVDARFGKKITKEIICPICNGPFEVTVRENRQDKHKKFCSQKCANGRKWSDKQKKKISETLATLYKENPEKFENFIASNQNNDRFSSKIERGLAKKLEQYGFKRHCRIKTDVINFDIDIVSEDKNIWIESDGPYHFRKIHKNHDFEKSQLRDYVENNEAINQNKLLIRIDNEKYKDIDIQVKLILNEINKWDKKIGEVIKFF